MKICLFGAASPTIHPEYVEKVEQLGAEMVRRGHAMVFGAGAHGLMGAAARGVHSQGGTLIGVVPKFFTDESIETLCDFCTEMIHTDTMRQRKQIMEDLADAFIIVPGGIGTFEEFFEILVLRQLCRTHKPIAIYNIRGYYDSLSAMLRNAIKEGFLRENCSDLFLLSDDPAALFSYLETSRNAHTVNELKDG